jgi:hypothetical protein
MKRTLAAAMAASLLTGLEAPVMAMSVHPMSFHQSHVEPFATSSQARVSFEANVPAAPAALPLYRLVASAAPSTLLSDSLSKRGDASLGMHGLRAMALAKDGTTRAYADFSSGDAELFPDLVSSHAAEPALAARVASTVFSRADVIARDATTFRLSAPSTLMGSAATKSAEPSVRERADAVPRPVLTYVSARRYAHGLPVYGTGSGATVGVTADGSVAAFVHRWKTAVPAGSVAAVNADVKSEIVRELQTFATSGEVVDVKSIGLVYYDGHANFMQPAYQFRAVIHEPFGRGSAEQPLIGYVPFGRLAEALPSLRAPAASPSSAQRPAAGSLGIRTDNANYTLNEYVIQNAGNGFVNESNDFYSGLDSQSDNFIREQYYWAQPFMYEGSSSRYYANSSYVLYTSAHGNVGIFATYDNPWTILYLSQINPGYGYWGGGVLAHWVISACDTVASMYDYSIMTGNSQNAFNVWWGIFKGMHDALGYRTESWIDGGNDYTFGQSAAAGGSIMSAWFNAIESDSAYTDGATYYEPNIGRYVQYGRGSVMADSRFLNNSIYNETFATPSTSLWNFWMNN